MVDNPSYTENVRKLTTAAEEDDAVTTGKILSELGPENWDKAIKDMISLNKKDIQENWEKENWSVFIPPLCAELDKSGNNETLTIYQQPTHNMNEPLAVAKISEDVSGKKLDPSTNKDLVRELTTAAENGDAVTTARILNSVGADKWGQVTKEMLELNRKDMRERKEGTWVANLSVGYERQGGTQSIKVWQQPEFFPPMPLAKITDKK